MTFPEYEYLQRLNRSSKFMELKVYIFQAWKVLQSGLGHWKSWKTNVPTDSDVFHMWRKYWKINAGLIC